MRVQLGGGIGSCLGTRGPAAKVVRAGLRRRRQILHRRRVGEQREGTSEVAGGKVSRGDREVEEGGAPGAEGGNRCVTPSHSVNGF